MFTFTIPLVGLIYIPKKYVGCDGEGQHFLNPNQFCRALFLEVYTDLNNTMKYYGKGNASLMLPFNFELLVHANQSSRSDWIKEIIDSWLDGMPDDGVANWVVSGHRDIPLKIECKLGHKK